MKNAIKKGILIMSLFAAFERAQAKAPGSLETLLQRPLITGASVSADWSSLSPGKKLSKKYTSDQNIRTIAVGGRPGVESIKTIHDQDLKDRTVILALDFFFWDSTLASQEKSLLALDLLLDKAEKHNLPIVLGEIPELLPGRQPGRAKLNQAITNSCSKLEQCAVMTFDQLHRQVLKDGYLDIKGRKYTIRELVPDGLHLSEPAGNELMDRLQNLIQEKIL